MPKKKDKPDAKKPVKKPAAKTPPKSAKSIPSALRAGATRVEVENSGLEVWLYDDANADKIRAGDLWRKLIGDAPTDGLIAGYSLLQDDAVRADVIVGPPLTPKELSVARWLEPQHAFLRLPSGRLAIESNDACRVGEEEPGEEGAFVDVPPGNYRMTLYRIDHEAMDREGLKWKGAEETIVLTPGGTKKDDPGCILPFEQRRDNSWVGKITVKGNTARGLVWFDDYWDTYFANIDTAIAARMGLTPGKYLKTTVPAQGITLVTAYAPTWDEGAKCRPPAGEQVEEFGYGAVIKPERWEGAETLFCRRVKTKTGIKDRNKNIWLEATFEVLDAKAQDPAARVRGDLLLDAGKRAYWRSLLKDQLYFETFPESLAIKLDGWLEGVNYDEIISLPDTVDRIDAAFAPAHLKPLGDFSFDVAGRNAPIEYTIRPYVGAKDFFAAVWASMQGLEIFLFSRLDGDRWVLTGTMDTGIAAHITKARPRLSVAGLEDPELLGSLVNHHRAHLKRVGGKPDPIPTAPADFARLYDDYLVAAID